MLGFVLLTLAVVALILFNRAFDAMAAERRFQIEIRAQAEAYRRWQIVIDALDRSYAARPQTTRHI